MAGMKPYQAALLGLLAMGVGAPAQAHFCGGPPRPAVAPKPAKGGAAPAKVDADAKGTQKLAPVADGPAKQALTLAPSYLPDAPFVVQKGVDDKPAPKADPAPKR